MSAQTGLNVTGSEVPKSRVEHTVASTPDTSQALPIYTTHLNGQARKGTHYDADSESRHGTSHVLLTHHHYHIYDARKNSIVQQKITCDPNVLNMEYATCSLNRSAHNYCGFHVTLQSGVTVGKGLNVKVFERAPTPLSGGLVLCPLVLFHETTVL